MSLWVRGCFFYPRPTPLHPPALGDPGWDFFCFWGVTSPSLWFGYPRKAWGMWPGVSQDSLVFWNWAGTAPSNTFFPLNVPPFSLCLRGRGIFSHPRRNFTTLLSGRPNPDSAVVNLARKPPPPTLLFDKSLFKLIPSPSVSRFHFLSELVRRFGYSVLPGTVLWVLGGGGPRKGSREGPG